MAVQKVCFTLKCVLNMNHLVLIYDVLVFNYDLKDSFAVVIRFVKFAKKLVRNMHKFDDLSRKNSL